MTDRVQRGSAPAKLAPRSTSVRTPTTLTEKANESSRGRGMDRSKEEAKASKKAAKAKLKAEKKRHGNPVADAPAPTSPVVSPAERSARAAEKQVKLQRYRVALALLMAVVALATFAITVKPWKYLTPDGDSRREPATPEVDTPGEATP